MGAGVRAREEQQLGVTACGYSGHSGYGGYNLRTWEPTIVEQQLGGGGHVSEATERERAPRRLTLDLGAISLWRDLDLRVCELRCVLSCAVA